ncbi:hypothetical protein AYI70_g11709 [Smittium culicis]|uniref:Elongator complex protein 6 n=1 Tax=Smittium culicis TaxID=133412 RepID=A0A1R1X0P2_9FUNG|nr:hypothetical protein AYI70_g11709 [Smittium culicis]
MVYETFATAVGFAAKVPDAGTMGVRIDQLGATVDFEFVDGVTETSPLSALKAHHLAGTINPAVSAKSTVLSGIVDLSDLDFVAYMMRAVVGASGKRLGAVYVHALGNLVDIGVPARALRMFIDTLKEYLEQSSGYLVVLTGCEQQVISELDSSDDYVVLLRGLVRKSDVVVQVENLVSGYSAEVTGQMSMYAQPHYKAEIPGPKVLFYKTMETKTNYFAPGQQATIK